jgi:hypothetical protein
LLWEYPIDLVFNLYQAEIENRQDELKAEMIGQTLAVSQAIGDALDLVLNKGKGEILKHWLKSLDTRTEAQPGETAPAPKPKRSKLSQDAIAFFSGLPVKPKKD